MAQNGERTRSRSKPDRSKHARCVDATARQSAQQSKVDVKMNGQSMNGHQPSGRPICYVTTRYPAISHTFIQREIDELRKDGIEVLTAAQHRTELKDLLTDGDRRNYETTVTCTPTSVSEALAVARTAVRHPRAASSTIIRALRTGRADTALVKKRLAYAVEAITLWSHGADRGIGHIHAHFAQGPAYLAMLAAHFQSKVEPSNAWTWSYTMHGPHEFHDESVFALGPLTKAADYVICISDYARSQLMRQLPAAEWHKLLVHHCGVDPAAFTPRPSGDREPGPLRLLTVARFDPMKGHIVLVEALALLLERGIEAELDVIGDGPTRADIEERIGQLGLNSSGTPSVRMHGSIGQDRIVPFFQRADVFCLPSFGEGVPVVLMEAMACGLPVVTSRIAGIQELVEDGASGYVIAPGRADLVADAIARLAADPALRASFGTHGRAAVQEGFDITRIGPEIAALHRSGVSLGALTKPSRATKSRS